MVFFTSSSPYNDCSYLINLSFVLFLVRFYGNRNKKYHNSQKSPFYKPTVSIGTFERIGWRFTFSSRSTVSSDELTVYGVDLL